MEFFDDEPALCPICGGVKPNKNWDKETACTCTCVSCSDTKEFD